jgi:hypothetical protein|tara:strand:+ start:165 stop:530 length:366 start_codon:yes stop_codon:yes gene_type:complete
MAEKSTGFDITKYQLTGENYIEKVTIPETGDTFEVELKPMSWSRRNKIVSRCLKLDGAGNNAFDGDFYMKECLKEMIIKAPWGATTESFLVSIDERLGKALEAVVPSAFEQESGADKIKKE